MSQGEEEEEGGEKTKYTLAFHAEGKNHSNIRLKMRVSKAKEDFSASRNIRCWNVSQNFR